MPGYKVTKEVNRSETTDRRLCGHDLEVLSTCLFSVERGYLVYRKALNDAAGSTPSAAGVTSVALKHDHV